MLRTRLMRYPLFIQVRGSSNWLWNSGIPFFVLNKIIPTELTNKSKKCTARGKRMYRALLKSLSAACCAKVPPKIIADIISADIDSKISAA